MKSVTIDQVMAWRPCGTYTQERVAELFAGRETLSPRDIMALDIPATDRFWALARPAFLSKESLHLLACTIAEDMLPFFEDECPDDKRPRRAIETKRAWLRGGISNEELADAQYDARVAASGVDCALASAAVHPASYNLAAATARVAASAASATSWAATYDVANALASAAAHAAAWTAAADAVINVAATVANTVWDRYLAMLMERVQKEKAE